jgi:hypothetical protein
MRLQSGSALRSVPRVTGGPDLLVGPSQLTGCPTLKHRSLARDPWSWISLGCALSAASRHSAAKLLPRKSEAFWARFRRDSAGDSLEVVHDQRPPTTCHAQNRQFQLPTTTPNDTWRVRALLRRVAATPRWLGQRHQPSSRVRKKSAESPRAVIALSIAGPYGVITSGSMWP